MNSAMLFSVVICTRNRAAYLDTCLRSVVAQTAAAPDAEAIVVDNGSSDRTSAVADRFRQAAGVRYVQESIVGLSQARNTGARAARGVYVAYVDDDAVIGAQWLDSARQVLRTAIPGPVWFGGPIELAWSQPAPAWLSEDLQECLGRLRLGEAARWLGPQERLGGGNSFFDRRVLLELGGFDVRLGRKSGRLLSGEETQLQRRMEAAGHRLYYHPGIVLHHHVPPDRLRSAFFYRRYFWGGVTDCTIRRTLQQAGIAGHADPLPAAADHRGGESSRRARIFGSVRHAIGLSPQYRERVRGRIYLAYAAGYLSALVGLWGRSGPPGGDEAIRPAAADSRAAQEPGASREP